MSEKPNWDRIYRDYSPKVLSYIRGHINNPSDAEDLCTEVFMKAMRYEAPATVSSWLYTITRNTVIDYYRTHKVMSEIPETLADDSDVAEGLLQEDTLEGLAAALKTLKEKERDVIVMHYYKRMTLRKISEIMGISYQYTKMLHNTGLHRLKEALTVLDE